MTSEEIHAGGALAGRLLGSVGAAVEQTHASIAGRVFSALGPGVEPVRVAHDAISAAAYGGVGVGLRHVPRGAGAIAALRADVDAPAAGDSVVGGLALAALNAAAGDRLAEEGSPLAVEMQLRAGGGRVALDPPSVSAAYPDAAGRVVVFLHGLGGNEEVWRLDPLGREGLHRLVYGDLLRDELGITPVYVRYNTGRRISANGRDLAALLDALVAAWPVPVTSLALVGHSMGGLVARSACHVAAGGDHAWLGVTRQLVCLGSPHGGAPLERGANALGHVLRALPETRPWAEIVNGRSVGIKDLRYGAVADEDWDGHDPDEFLRDRRTEIAVPAGIVVHTVSAALTADPEHPFAGVVGDLLVMRESAAGPSRSRKLAVSEEHHRHLDAANHWTLLSHPDVADALRAWLAPAGDDVFHPSVV